MSSRGKTKVNENSPIDLYPKKNKDPFYYKVIDGKTYWYRYYTYKENVKGEIRVLRQCGYKIKTEYIGDGRYIIWLWRVS
jgi:hypothetical protein